MSSSQRNGEIVMPNGPYCRLCGRKLTDESDQWAGRCNNDENCARRVKEQVAFSTSIVDEIVAEETVEELKAEIERLKAQLKHRYTHTEVAQWLAAYHGKYREKTLVEYVAELRDKAMEGELP